MTVRNTKWSYAGQVIRRTDRRWAIRVTQAKVEDRLVKIRKKKWTKVGQAIRRSDDKWTITVTHRLKTGAGDDQKKYMDLGR